VVIGKVQARARSGRTDTSRKTDTTKISERRKKSGEKRKEKNSVMFDIEHRTSIETYV